jgi:hypothetical protein
MKNIKYIILTALLMAPFSSCTDWLEVKPLDKMVLEDYWKSGSDVESTMLSCYRAMLTEDFITRIVLGGELRSDNVVEGGNEMSEEERLMYNANILPSNSLVTWSCFYNVINYCNTVIQMAPGVVDVDPDYSTGSLKANLAEAVAVRALCYFYLVRLYGDVPYITWPSVDDDQDFKVAQSPRDSILDCLITDLVDAERSAAKSWGTFEQTKGRMTKNSIRALLADIYLWQNRYQECVDICNKVLAEELTENDMNNLLSRGDRLNGSELYLVTPITKTVTYQNSYAYTRIFGTGNSYESIFELQFDPVNNRNSAVEKLYGYIGQNPHLTAAAHLAEGTDPGLSVNTFRTGSTGEGDLRGKDSYVLPKSGGYYTIFKYRGQERTDASGTSTNDMYVYKSESMTPNWIVYRLADVILMKAEALVELGGQSQLEEAIALCNRTYQRSNPDITTEDGLYNFASYPSQAAMRNLVFLERQREFLFEGKRWFDILRRIRREGNPSQIVSSYITRKYTTNSGIVGSKMSVMDALYLPIHKDEMIVNPLLKQNPYYQSLIEEMNIK